MVHDVPGEFRVMPPIVHLPCVRFEEEVVMDVVPVLVSKSNNVSASG
jgi:hypothetical protein